MVILKLVATSTATSNGTSIIERPTLLKKVSFDATRSIAERNPEDHLPLPLQDKLLHSMDIHWLWPISGHSSALRQLHRSRRLGTSRTRWL